MPRLNSILQSVLHFVKEAGDPQTQKLAFSVLAKMVISWGVSESGHLKGMPAKLSKKGPGSAKADKGKQPEATPPKSALPGFDQFIYESVVPILFEVPMNPAFNPGDGQCYLVMSEIASLQKTIVQTQGSKYLEFLSMVYLPSIRCPADTAQQFLAALQQMDNKQLRKFLQVCILSLKYIRTKELRLNVQHSPRTFFRVSAHSIVKAMKACLSTSLGDSRIPNIS